jgi:hypothetical protein
VNEYYHIDNFVKLYGHVLILINEQEIWLKVDGVELDPLVAYKQFGRPKKARKRQFEKNRNSGKRLGGELLYIAENVVLWDIIELSV